MELNNHTVYSLVGELPMGLRGYKKKYANKYKKIECKALERCIESCLWMNNIHLRILPQREM